MRTGDHDRPPGPDDDTLLAAVGQVWQLVDPPPVDLAAGVLARIAAEDLEFDLLTLVESEDTLSGVRSAAEAEPDALREEVGSWSLEYAHPEFRVYLRLNRIEDRTRVDGWVVPSRELTVRLLSEVLDESMETSVDEFGRFDLPAVPAGLARIVFIDQTTPARRPRVTPPFWI